MKIIITVQCYDFGEKNRRDVISTMSDSGSFENLWLTT